MSQNRVEGRVMGKEGARPPKLPKRGPELDEPVLARGLILQARLWATLHPTMCQEVRDHIALRVIEELGAAMD
ncbi:hypothetical protein [Swingsia samuiensis]|uniref:Uncharacterized protein n=1 Tax=Swingsia samuiensis TaxID=1293412 RepID=A0A4Y6UK37_9PROT|nr:hypothetical protein [Swingsia samuiensis]QDH17434.1 hypothetical protein E3D00_07550 [Swingsia samuiensis]